MRHIAGITPVALAMVGGLSGCDAADPEAGRVKPVYEGVDTALLEDGLVRFKVAMYGARDASDVEDYAECAAAQYALIRGYGFARHLRTKVDEEAGLWRGDAVYTISPALPRGVRTIDAEVVSASCAENGIPMV
ncbi:hypothetical protein [Marivita sp.]|uniref:hypothetical protein n=1 Tax=Marivita sp. TaxID=2003365 RepID=UPI0025C30AD5|nr:hypothetical protein [Marivita sp.]